MTGAEQRDTGWSHLSAALFNAPQTSTAPLKRERCSLYQRPRPRWVAGKLCSSPASSDPAEKLSPRGKSSSQLHFPRGNPSPALAVLGFGVQITHSSPRRHPYLPENCTKGSEGEGINNLLPPCRAFLCLCAPASSRGGHRLRPPSPCSPASPDPPPLDTPGEQRAALSPEMGC